MVGLQRSLGNQAIQRFLADTMVQAKRTVNQPGDVFEQEADQIAEHVMGMADRAAPGHQFVSEPEPAGTPTMVDELLETPGQQLDPATRAFFEPRFRADFSQVRVHTGGRATESARALRAQAYTVGNDIVFGHGAFQPMTDSGRRLVAHELTHVVQQRAGGAVPQVQRQLFPPLPVIVRPAPASAPPVEVNAVDSRQEPSIEWYKPWRYTGPLTWLFRGDVEMTDITSMVDNVLKLLNGRRMLRLNIMDHGNASGVEIGSDWLASPVDVTRVAGTLGRLRSHFTNDAIVHFQNCHAGQNRGLICALAATLGAPVYAGTGLHNPLVGFNFSDYVRCDPNGTFNPNAGRPQTPIRPAPPLTGEGETAA